MIRGFETRVSNPFHHRRGVLHRHAVVTWFKTRVSNSFGCRVVLNRDVMCCGDLQFETHVSNFFRRWCMCGVRRVNVLVLVGRIDYLRVKNISSI